MRFFYSLFPLVLATTIVLSAGCRSDQPQPDQTKADEKAADPNILTLSDESAKVAGLKFAEVREESIAAPIAATGRISINEDRSVRVGSLFTGRIVEVSANVGDRVQKGRMLARMHTHEVHEAQAEFAKARAELEQKKKAADFTKSLLDRAERLYQAKALSQNELEKARVEYNAAQQDIARAEAEVERAIGHREHLGLPDTIDYDALVIIRAPAAGIVIKREITPGASVNPGDNLFFISDFNSVWAVAEVQEKFLADLKPGLLAQIRVAAYPEEVFSGRIARIGEMLNPETRTVEVRCLADNRAGKLKPEMYATIDLLTGENRAAMTIEQSALQEMDGQTIVFIAREANRFEKRAVKTGRRLGDRIEIVEGLARGDRVVAEGSFLLKSELLKAKSGDDE